MREAGRLSLATAAPAARYTLCACGVVAASKGTSLPKPNYAFAKRQRDLAKQQKKEEKKQKKAAQKAVPGEPAPDPAAPDTSKAAG